MFTIATCLLFLQVISTSQIFAVVDATPLSIHGKDLVLPKALSRDTATPTDQLSTHNNIASKNTLSTRDLKPNPNIRPPPVLPTYKPPCEGFLDCAHVIACDASKRFPTQTIVLLFGAYIFHGILNQHEHDPIGPEGRNNLVIRVCNFVTNGLVGEFWLVAVMCTGVR